MNVSNNSPDADKVLSDFGINHNLLKSDIKRFWGELEPPIRISETRIFHDFSMGAFSYVSGGFLYHTHVGRYSSLSNHLHIGQNNHPLNWLSTHPFQYQRGIFELRDTFEFKSEYEKDRHDHVKKPKLDYPKPTKIGNDCWIATGVYVKNGVSIADGAVVGARSVVTKDIPPYAIAVGCPARIIGFRFNDEIIERLLSIKWWNYAPWQLRDLDLSNPERALDMLERKINGGLTKYSPKILTVIKV